ncbi:MAG: ABC transporter ATP-binding protein [Candidatus Thermoplasmatota archaeon]|nr:ABC transporter ATP-binding protein [Candidatus Thermoplasmatota archaeon]
MDCDSMTNIIEVKDIVKVYRNGVKAVKGISFSVSKGEIFGLLGPNGAGKSTLLKMLSTLLRPTSGTATVDGLDIVKDAGEIRKRIGLVAEKMILYDYLTPYENLKLFGKLYNIEEKALDERIDELLKTVDMDKWKNERIKNFSTGMRQRINLIRGLINYPEVLFLDEPTLGLDPHSSVEIRRLVAKLNREMGITVILTTHYMEEVDALANRIAIINKGEIAALDTSENLKRKISEEKVLEVKITDSAKAIESIRALDCVRDVSSRDGELRIYGQGENFVDSVIDRIKSSDSRIISIKEIEPSLEDVFIKLTFGGE